MTSFQLARSKITPHVAIDASARRLVFEGDCYPENPVVFFAPFFSALEDYLAGARPPDFAADFRLRYVNSASTVTLQRLFARLDQASQGGTQVHITWAHDPEDDVNEELGHDLSRCCRHVEVEHHASPAS